MEGPEAWCDMGHHRRQEAHWELRTQHLGLPVCTNASCPAGVEGKGNSGLGCTEQESGFLH